MNSIVIYLFQLSVKNFQCNSLYQFKIQCEKKAKPGIDFVHYTSLKATKNVHLLTREENISSLAYVQQLGGKGLLEQGLSVTTAVKNKVLWLNFLACHF